MLPAAGTESCRRHNQETAGSGPTPTAGRGVRSAGCGPDSGRGPRPTTAPGWVVGRVELSVGSRPTAPVCPPRFGARLRSTLPCWSSEGSRTGRRNAGGTCGRARSLWPKGRLKEEPTVEPSAGQKRFAAATGQEMRHCGGKTVKFRRQGCTSDMSLGSEVTDVTRPLVAVRPIVERSNEVNFDGNRGWLHSVARGSEIPLERKGGCCALRVHLLGDATGFSWQA